MPQTLPNDWLSIQFSHLLLLHVLDIHFSILKHPRLSIFTHPLFHLNFNAMFFRLQAYKKKNKQNTLGLEGKHMYQNRLLDLFYFEHTQHHVLSGLIPKSTLESHLYGLMNMPHIKRKVQLKSSNTVKKST